MRKCRVALVSPLRDGANAIEVLGEEARAFIDDWDRRVRCLSVAVRLRETIPTTPPSARAAVWCCARTVASATAARACLVSMELARPTSFAATMCSLSADQIAAAGKIVAPGDYRGIEFAGACFDRRGWRCLLASFRPGITFAIKGPWKRGNL